MEEMNMEVVNTQTVDVPADFELQESLELTDKQKTWLTIGAAVVTAGGFYLYTKVKDPAAAAYEQHKINKANKKAKKEAKKKLLEKFEEDWEAAHEPATEPTDDSSTEQPTEE